MPKFSLLVPVYNQFWNLRKNFATLVNQTHDDYEICIVDDGSYDSSTEVLLAYAKANTNVHLQRHHETRGLGQTKNDLVAMASGEYLIFINPTDSLNVDFLISIADVLQGGNVDILKHQNTLDSSGSFSNLTFPQISCGERFLLKWCGNVNSLDLDSWSFVIRKELFNGITFPDTSLYEDYAVIPLLIARAKSAREICPVGYCHVPYEETADTNLTPDEIVVREDQKLRLLAKQTQLTCALLAKARINGCIKDNYFDILRRRYDIQLNRVLELQEMYYGDKPRC